MKIRQVLLFALIGATFYTHSPDEEIDLREKVTGIPKKQPPQDPELPADVRVIFDAAHASGQAYAALRAKNQPTDKWKRQELDRLKDVDICIAAIQMQRAVDEGTRNLFNALNLKNRKAISEGEFKPKTRTAPKRIARFRGKLLPPLPIKRPPGSLEKPVIDKMKIFGEKSKGSAIVPINHGGRKPRRLPPLAGPTRSITGGSEESPDKTPMNRRVPRSRAQTPEGGKTPTTHPDSQYSALDDL